MMERTLHRDFYFSDEIFPREKERIFCREWVCAGREEELPDPGITWSRGRRGKRPGGAHPRGQARRPLQRLPSSRVPPGARGLHGILHRRHPLSLSLLDLYPRRRAPDRSLPRRGDRVLQGGPRPPSGGYRELGRVLLPQPHPGRGGCPRHGLCASSGAGAGAASAAIRWRSSVRRRRIAYEVEANWKVLLENYNECYHCGPVHPELCRLVPAFKQRGGSDLDWERGIPHREGAWTFTETGTTNRRPFEASTRTSGSATKAS